MHETSKYHGTSISHKGMNKCSLCKVLRKFLGKIKLMGEVLCIKGMQDQQVSMWTINSGWSGPRISAAQREPSLLALMEEEAVTKVTK